MPPVTEPTVHQAASRNARSGRASDIGTSITSGGIGKKELSTNATAVNIPRACFLPAAATHQSYKRRSKERGLAASTVIGTLQVRERMDQRRLRTRLVSSATTLRRAAACTRSFGTFSAMPNICSRRLISAQTSSGWTPECTPVSYTHLRAHETRHDL